jgi:hypothetical protein
MPGFSIMDESEISRIVVLQNLKRYTSRWINNRFSLKIDKEGEEPAED